MCEIDINGVKITLTKEQLAQIDKQRTNKAITTDDINTIEDAEKVLEGQPFHTKYEEKDFCRYKDWVSYQLETLAKAINFIYNGRKEWNFKEGNFSYFPYFNLASGGWVYYGGSDYCCVSSAGVVAYFPSQELAENFGKKFIHLYREILPKIN